MIVNSNIPQNPVWIREEIDGKRKVTLRRNFTSEDIDGETRITFEEVDIFPDDRPDLGDYVRENFTGLFESGTAGEVIG